MPRPAETGSGESEGLRFAWVSRQGLVRSGNEDDFAIERLDPGRLLVIVADGMGGHDRGEIASRMAVETLLTADRGPFTGALGVAAYDTLLGALLEADRTLADLATGESHNPGCTVVAAVVAASGRSLHLHAGDCRLYHFREGEAIYRTTDHSVAEIAYREGRITEDEMRSYAGAGLVLSCLGGDRSAQPEVEPRWADALPEENQPAFRALEPGDGLLLCSDGISGVVDPAEIRAAGAAHFADPAGLVAALEAAALAAGAPDNYTAVAIACTGCSTAGGDDAR